jgi:hypothetical protein
MVIVALQYTKIFRNLTHIFNQYFLGDLMFLKKKLVDHLNDCILWV